MKTYFMRGPAPAIHLVLVACLALVAGCAEMQIASPFGPQFPPDDPADSCNGQLQALRADYEYFTAPLVSQAVAEQTTGLLQGIGFALVSGQGVSGAAMDQYMENFAKSMIQAGISAATRGYLESIGQQQSGNWTEVASRVDSDATGDSQRLAGVQTKISALEKCRRKQADVVEGNFKRGKIAKKEAIAQFEDLKKVVQRDNALIERIVGSSSERIEVYAEADRFVTKQPQAKRKKTSRGVAKAKTNQKKAEQAQKEVAALEQVIDGRKSGIVS